MAAYNIEQIKDKKKLVKLANYGTAERRDMRPKVLIGAGKEKPFIEGDILDANATLNLIEDTYDKGRIFRSFSKEGKKIDKEIKELLEKTNENYEQLSSAIADNKEDADQKIDQLSSKVDNIESNIPNLRRVVDIQLQSVLDGTKTYLVTKQGDVQEEMQISDGEKGEQGEKGDPFTYEDFTPEQIEGLKVKGDRGISISSLEQTQTAYTSGGVNEFTITLDDGTVSRWYVRNGQKGDATKIWVNANTVHSGYYDSDNHEIKLLNADGGIMSIIDATAFIKDGMISDAYVEDGYIVIVFNTDAGQTPIMIPVTDIFDADDYYTKLDTDARIAEDVLVETQRAQAAELQLTNNLAQEVSDRQSGDTTLNTKIETETTRATNAEEALSDAIDAEESTRIQEIDDLQDLLDAYIQSNDAAVQAEISRATAAEQTNATAIATESSRAQSAELALQGAINTEASTRAAAITAEETRATTAELALLDNIDAEEQRATAAEHGLQTAVDELEQSAGQGITEVQRALNDEITRATLAEQQISSDLSAEITRATNADNANSTAISNEVARATLSELQNATDIDAIEALIPSQATSENQLADKAFVNSSIATNTATFVGTFNSITDLYAVTTADINDYGYVVTTDSVGNTKYNRYKYDGSQWDFEYSLNNSSFTAEEWASIQSGMTQALREKLESLPSSATTSIGISVPTGFTVTGSPIVSSGTIAINFANGYSIPTIASQTNWDTAYGWGNHANAGYVKQVKVGTDAYNPTGGIVSLPAYPTSLPASDVYSWAKASTKPSYTLDEISDGTLRRLANYLPLSGGTMTGDIVLTGGNIIATGNSNVLVFRHLDGQDGYGDYGLYLQYNNAVVEGRNTKVYFGGSDYYIDKGYYNGSCNYATSAGKLQTARTLWGNSFDGSADIGGTIVFHDDIRTEGYSVSNRMNALINFGSNMKTDSPAAAYYPWFGSSDGVYTRGYFNTVIIGTYHLQTDNCGLYFGISYDDANSDTFYYFSRQGVASFPYLTLANSIEVGGGIYSNNNSAYPFRLRRFYDDNERFDIYVNDVAVWLDAYDSDGWSSFIFRSNGTEFVRFDGYHQCVGLATASPRAKLDVYGVNSSVIIGKTAGTPGASTARKMRLGLATAGHTGSEYWAFSIDDRNNSNSLLQIGYTDSDSNNMLVIKHDGSVGVCFTGNSAPSYPLHVNGDAAATNFYTTSDSSKKDNITSLSEHIRKFTLKETGKEHYGVIAQEVEEMFREGEEGSYTVNYNSILSYYIGLLENRVAELENKIKELSHG